MRQRRRGRGGKAALDQNRTRNELLLRPAFWNCPDPQNVLFCRSQGGDGDPAAPQAVEAVLCISRPAQQKLVHSRFRQFPVLRGRAIAKARLPRRCTMYLSICRALCVCPGRPVRDTSSGTSGLRVRRKDGQEFSGRARFVIENRTVIEKKKRSLLLQDGAANGSRTAPFCHCRPTTTLLENEGQGYRYNGLLCGPPPPLLPLRTAPYLYILVPDCLANS